MSDLTPGERFAEGRLANRKLVEAKTNTRQMINSLLLLVVIAAALVLPIAVFAVWRVLLK